MTYRKLCCISLLVTVLATLSAGAAEEQQKTSFSGVLVDPITQLPAVGVKLELVDPGEYHTTTEANGRFTFADIPVGEYRFMFAFLHEEKEPQPSILIAKKIKVEAGGQEVRVKREALREVTKEDTPQLKNVTFSDERKRQDVKAAVILREMLGIDWPEEYMSVPAVFRPGTCRLSSIRVVDGSTGTEIPFQLSDIKYGNSDFVDSCTVTFPATLSPMQNKVYGIANDWREGYAIPQFETDLVSEPDKEKGGYILRNALVAFRLPMLGTHRIAETDCPAPILAVRGPDKVWFGSGKLVSDRKPSLYICQQTTSGPLFHEFKITYKFNEQAATEAHPAQPAGEYEVTLRLYANRDYLEMQERMTGDLQESFRFSLTPGLKPGTFLCDDNGAPGFLDITQPPAEEKTLGFMRAWNPPGIRNSHNWFGVSAASDRKDAFGVVQIDGGHWEFSTRDDWGDGTWVRTADDNTEVRMVRTRDDAYLELPHRQGTRKLALVVFDKEQNWTAASVAAALKPEHPLSHHLNRLHLRLSQMNLSRWADIHPEKALPEDRPHLLFTLDKFPELKDRFERTPNSFPPQVSDVFSGSRRMTHALREEMLWQTMILRDSLLGGENEKVLTGSSSSLADPSTLAPRIKFLALLYDANVRSGLFSNEERQLVLGTLLLAAADLSSPNYWGRCSYSPAASAYRDTSLTWIALLLSRHPDSQNWMSQARNTAVATMTNVLGTGGMPRSTGELCAMLNLWTELAPLIQTNSSSNPSAPPTGWNAYRQLLGRVAELTAPPDKARGGARLLPTVGALPQTEPMSLAFMGEAAKLMASSDPDLAGRLAWAWEQAGRPIFHPQMPYARLMQPFREPMAVPPKAPAKEESVRLAGFGSLIRTNFAQPTEAYLLFKCGGPTLFHQDQESLVFYAFGNPILLDEGPAHEGVWAHNVVRIDERTHNAAGSISEDAEYEDDSYVVGTVVIDTMSQLKEKTPAEVRDAVKTGKLPQGHRPNGGETSEMIPAMMPLERPVTVTRHVLFNKSRQYAVILDRVQGNLPSEVFWNVRADSARVENGRAYFVSPYGVDAEFHLFGSGEIHASLVADGPQRWNLRVTQTMPKSAPAKTTEPAASTTAPGGAKPAEPELPVIEYLTILCPIPREGTIQYAPPVVEKLPGFSGVRMSYNGITRYIFLSDKEVEYEHNKVFFKGTRGILTIFPTHIDVALLDKGKLLYDGVGLETSAGSMSLRFAKGGLVEGKVDGADKLVTFYGLGYRPGSLSFRTDGQEFNPEGNRDAIKYGIPEGNHKVTVYPR